ncbi:NADAR domain-containing protein [Okeanomitos corallinicola TIOX110]|uniref:NADAR domain-containing protein n=1 Tax=Okeanomitos corallinicola TIOX110 TaxID=3133117 RepID=A0ABZ2UTS7_9CYAN
MTIYFYKAGQPYGCFSNFSPHPIEMEGVCWPTVEHYYQAQKFVGSKDEEIIPLIHAASTPEKAAALGRSTARALRTDWEIVKTDIMRVAVLKKFLTHAQIREVLLVTADEILIENSPTDYFWGCGADHTGENHLGKILMSVREEIRQSLYISVKSNT